MEDEKFIISITVDDTISHDVFIDHLTSSIEKVFEKLGRRKVDVYASFRSAKIVIGGSESRKFMNRLYDYLNGTFNVHTTSLSFSERDDGPISYKERLSYE